MGRFIQPATDMINHVFSPWSQRAFLFGVVSVIAAYGSTKYRRWSVLRDYMESSPTEGDRQVVAQYRRVLKHTYVMPRIEDVLQRN